MIEIELIPFTVTEKGQTSWTSTMKKKLAMQDLEYTKLSLERNINNDIPMIFNDDIHLSLSINKKTLKIEIDYSKIKSKSTVNLIKLWFSKDIVSFSEKWLMLC